MVVGSQLLMVGNGERLLLTRVIEIVCVACIYIVSARLGQLFAIEPGNVTPVWLPSGLMIALAFIRGPGIWPGIFLGAFLGNVWAYFSIESVSLAFKSIFAGSFNGIGDVLSTVVIVQLFLKFSKVDKVLSAFKGFVLFLVFCVLIGPGISAVFGVTSLAAFGFLEWTNYWKVLATWWTGDGVGVLLLAPLILSWHQLKNTNISSSMTLTIVLVIASMVLASVLFKVVDIPFWLYLVSYCLAPLLLISSLYLGQHNCFTALLIFSSVAIISTSSGFGPFSLSSENINLIELQLFIAVMTVVIGFLSITVRQRYEAELNAIKKEKSLSEAQKLANLGNWELDLTNNHLTWSDEVFRIFELDQARFDASYESFMSKVHPDDRELVNKAYANSIEEKTAYDIEHRLLMDDGRIKYVNERCETEYDQDGKAIRSIGSVLDITERKSAEQKIIHQAHYDSLTGLPNRFLTIDRLSQLLLEADREKTKVAVLFLDLDFFKKINDSMGHEVGDNLLIQVAKRMQSTVRADDTVGRLGGDEFLVLLRGLHGADEARFIVESLQECCSAPFFIDSRKIVISSSIGVVMYPGDGETPTEVLRNADLAMYLAKEQGRNKYSFFTEEMNSVVSRNLAIEENMRGAIDKKEFSVLFQPQLDLKTNTIFRAEALLRWKNDVLGRVSPGEFIPVAESNGLIVELGQFVLDCSLSLIREVKEDYGRDIVLSINISPRQFRDINLVDYIERAIEQYDLKPECIELEITEGLLITGYAGVKSTLTKLHKLGIKISLDDFGTGYASLNYLRSYPFDELKIDRLFINDINKIEGKELVNAAIAMAHALHLSVVAEGVETEEQLKAVRKLGCDIAQGYLISKPINKNDFITLLNSHE